MSIMSFEPIGWCFLLNRCDWWNPPEELLWGDPKHVPNFCIKCWEFKNDN
jgi:hypothetical protein